MRGIELIRIRMGIIGDLLVYAAMNLRFPYATERIKQNCTDRVPQTQVRVYLNVFPVHEDEAHNRFH